MSDSNLRLDNKCENCGYTVDLGYCSNCGQKNVETRQSFGHLIAHFAEDFTHYDGAFWKTIKYLLFRPAKLTKDYLEGYRQSYVPPVKLYIFISFAAFLLLSLISSDDTASEKANADKKEIRHSAQIGNEKSIFKGRASIKTASLDTTNVVIVDKYSITSLKELDSLRALPKEQRISLLDYYSAKININSKQNNFSAYQVRELFIHTLPKVLFIYMPIFAFWLWLFHGKKRWYFFDHGIFTLHYFSFLLLFFAIILIISIIVNPVKNIFGNTVMALLWAVYFIYSFFYFFRAHRKMYGESRIISRLKSFALFSINIVCILFVLTLSTIYILLNLH